MTTSVVIYDTEFWTDRGVQGRHWSGLYDYPPLLIQIGAIKCELSRGLPIIGEYASYVLPVDEYGRRAPLTDYLVQLTGISQNEFETSAIPLAGAMSSFAHFVNLDLMFSYGNDILASILPTCYLRSLTCPFTPRQVHDIRYILRHAGVTDELLTLHTSGTIASAFGLQLLDHTVHDALSDARSIVATIQHLNLTERLNLAWLSSPSPSPRAEKGASPRN